MEPVSSRIRFSLHGCDVELHGQIPPLMAAINRAMGDFAVDAFANHPSSPIVGMLRPFSQDEVSRSVSQSAVRITADNDSLEIYQQDERFWLIDDHWGMCELNILKGQWRSWVLPDALAEPDRIVERSMMWPMAQLLRSRGLHLLPAAAVVRDGFGVLMLSNFSIEPEMSILVRAGYRLIGQSWVALHEQFNRIEMLHMPGNVMRGQSRVDLTSEFCGCGASHAPCDAVLLVKSGRRPLSKIAPLSHSNAAGALRNSWPMMELHPHRRQGQLLPRIVERCRIFEAQFSRNHQEVLHLLETARYQRPPLPMRAVA